MMHFNDANFSEKKRKKNCKKIENAGSFESPHKEYLAMKKSSLPTETKVSLIPVTS